MRNIKITVEYDGTKYSGWQIQKNTGETIQQKIEQVLTEINQAKVSVCGASRTDAGVHALGQTANFLLNSSIPTANIPQAMNRLLPNDIICKEARDVGLTFHARHDAKGKKYRYRILNQRYRSVFKRDYAYYLKYPLNVTAMQQAGRYLEGTHDFSAFAASGSSIKDPVRTISSLEIKRRDGEIWLDIIGNGFLYKMVRIITGTLIELGSGQLTVAEIREIIANKERNQAGFTAPAHALTLMEVYY